MRRLVRSELAKARTTRTALGLALGLLAIVLLIVILTAALTTKSPEDAFGLERHRARDVLGPLGFATIFALLFGLLASTSEYRHGTISATFLVSPWRSRVVTAKLVSSGLVGLLLAAVTVAVAAPIGLLWLSARGFELDGGEIWRMLVGVAIGSFLWGALGAGLGAIVKAQVPALIGALAWLLVVESIFQGLLPRVERFLPGGAFDAIFARQNDHTLPFAAGLGVSVAYVVAAGAVGAVLTERRDVT